VRRNVILNVPEVVTRILVTAMVVWTAGGEFIAISHVRKKTVKLVNK
jgi:hypothetical protein